MIYFCDKDSGKFLFRLRDDPIVKLTHMLALKCLARGIDPDALEILVPIPQCETRKIMSTAKKLIALSTDAAPKLSARENQVYSRLILGRVNKEIAGDLNMSYRTVKFHVSSLLRKFDCENRGELIRRHH